MKFDLASRTQRRSRKPITLPDISTTKAQAATLSAIYAKVIAIWTAGAPHVVAEYESTLAEMQKDSAETTGSSIESLGEQIRRLVLMLTPELRDWAFKVEDVHRGKWVRNVFSATSVDLTTILTPGDMTDTVEEVINWNVALIKDVNDEIRRRIVASVFTGFQQRKAAATIAKEISEAVGMARARARRIAADQTVKLGARLNRARQEQAGLTHFKWRHSAKEHPRLRHLARNGKVYPWENSGIPADDMPGVPPFCGCTAQGVVTFGDD